MSSNLSLQSYLLPHPLIRPNPQIHSSTLISRPPKSMNKSKTANQRVQAPARSLSRKSSADKRIQVHTGLGRGDAAPFVQQYIIRGGIASYRAGWMAFTIRDIVRHPYVATYCATRPPLSASGRDTLTRDVKICSKISPGRRQCISPPSTYSWDIRAPSPLCRIIEQSFSNLKNVSSMHLADASRKDTFTSSLGSFFLFNFFFLLFLWCSSFCWARLVAILRRIAGHCT